MTDDMFRPPVNRAMKVLDRSFFRKKIPLSAARALENKDISILKTELDRSKDSLRLPRLPSVVPDPFQGIDGKRCILLRPQKNDQGSAIYYHRLVA